MTTAVALRTPGSGPWGCRLRVTVSSSVQVLIRGIEVFGSALSENEPDRFWGVYESAVVYEQVIEKGKWKPSATAIAAASGVALDIQARGQDTVSELVSHLASASAGASGVSRKTRTEAPASRRRTEGPVSECCGLASQAPPSRFDLGQPFRG